MDTKLAIERACDALGSASKLAEVVGKSPQFISQLVNGKRPIPETLCLLIEEATRGAVRCEDLRPDVPWHILRGQSALADSPEERPAA